jgi:hypothetical protein
LAQYSGALLLLPLLPQRRPLKPLPSEVWTKIFRYTLHPNSSRPTSRTSLLTICKVFTVRVAPNFSAGQSPLVLTYSCTGSYLAAHVPPGPYF